MKNDADATTPLQAQTERLLRTLREINAENRELKETCQALRLKNVVMTRSFNSFVKATSTFTTAKQYNSIACEALKINSESPVPSLATSAN